MLQRVSLIFSREEGAASLAGLKVELNLAFGWLADKWLHDFSFNRTHNLGFFLAKGKRAGAKSFWNDALILSECPAIHIAVSIAPDALADTFH